MRRAELTLLVALAACKGSTTPDERPIAIRDAAPRSIDLGAVCESGPTCGTKRRIALEENVQSTAFRTPAPCKLDDGLENDQRMLALLNNDVGQAHCIADAKLFAYRACAECRNVTGGYSVVAQIDELTAAQALAIQTRLALPKEQALVGVDAWRQALAAKAASKPRPKPAARKPQGDASTSRLDDDAAAATFVLASR